MSFRQFIATYFNNHAESKDQHWNVKLQSRYYKTNKERAMTAIEHMLQKNGDFEINAISNEHGEISVNKTKGKKAFIVATVVMVRPFRTAVDFSVTSESIFPFDFGYSTKLIQTLYTHLDSELPVLDKH
ncbi:cytosolic protein [Virgibacillus sp. 179-BFC.A HS]|uniref:Cytosolic protein n=1 Tax=Tigheibacillus jepli TaxID=3035914 RepID=A0ABU5CGB3_9BACI|nr:cytosolic protein [Virgibacillus sp. 179-BFC.A HS]MDY0405362.1 cytosolic protein [Virgibacillus sp. 179-BFC.A HS]